MIDFQAWLKDPNARRAALFEVTAYDGATPVQYNWSDVGYVSSPQDFIANAIYDGVILSVPEISERLDGQFAVGEIEVINVGEFDGLLQLAWQGHRGRLYLGDPEWSRDDFGLVVDGVVDDISSPQRDRIRIKYRDLKALLDVPVTTETLPNGEPVPVCFGRVFNLPLSLVDGPNHLYQANDGAIESLAVRDRGADLDGGATPVINLADATAELTAPPDGSVTADVVQADKTTAQIITALAARAGVPVDAASLTAYPNTAELGLYAGSGESIAALMTQVMETTGGIWRVNAAGAVEILQFAAPGVPGFTLQRGDIADDDLRVIRIEQPVKRISIGHGKNWSPQDADSLANELSDDLRSLYSRERSIVSTENDLGDGFPNAEIRPVKDTLFADEADAQAEADRLAALRCCIRTVYGVTAFVGLNEIQLADTINTESDRFGFDDGLDARTIAIKRRPTDNRVELEQWR